MKWNKYKRFNECLQEAFDTYTSRPSESENENFEDLEHELKQKIDSFDYIEKTMPATELSQYKRSHDYQYDDKNDPQLFEGVIVVLVCNGKSMIIDGNHRSNTLIEHYPKEHVCVLEITVSELL